jgi:hypothetical protein
MVQLVVVELELYKQDKLHPLIAEGKQQSVYLAHRSVYAHLPVTEMMQASSGSCSAGH